MSLRATYGMVAVPRATTHGGKAMEYRRLGRTGLKVSNLCLGAMMFGAWGNRDQDESIKIINAALDAGINFIDTADLYSVGESEEIVGRAIAGRRDEYVIATKFFNPMGKNPNQQGSSRRWVIEACENSLRRLGTDYIDLYQVHRPDPLTDIDETLGALSDLVHQGKVRYLGSSTFRPSQIVEAQWVAEKRGHQRFVCEQPPYAALIRGVEAEVLPTCERYGMGVICWGPLGGGWLSGRWRKGVDEVSSTRAERVPDRYDLSIPENQQKLDATEALAQLAEKSGLSLIHLALAFVLHHRAVTAAIIGPRTMEHLESQIGASSVKLSKDVLDEIDKIVTPGRDYSWTDAGWIPPEVVHAKLRRR
jgi:aryl-alcohol dehydrogenase-like predicted oxidoreductase